jgi:hypothetical protein
MHSEGQSPCVDIGNYVDIVDPVSNSKGVGGKSANTSRSYLPSIKREIVDTGWMHVGITKLCTARILFVITTAADKLKWQN